MEKKTLSQEAYEKIKQNLEDGRYEGYINGRQVAREMGIGFTPVREAFLQLQSEGLLRKVDNVGYFVNRVELEELIGIFQVRECIEMYVWNQVFDKITDEQVQKMKDLHEKEKVYFSQKNIKEYTKMDIQLHCVMLDFFGNKDLRTLYYNVRQRYLLCPVKTVKQASVEAMEEHAQWIAYVEQRKKKEALEYLQFHINNTKSRMKEGYITFLE